MTMEATTFSKLSPSQALPTAKMAYTIQSYGNDATGDFLITTTTYSGSDGAGGTLTGIFKPANKITADTSNSMDMRETSGGVFQIASRSSAGGGGNTLDGAYDQGGSGSGRQYQCG